jgi:hypothetical protein
MFVRRVLLGGVILEAPNHVRVVVGWSSCHHRLCVGVMCSLSQKLFGRGFGLVA